MTGPGAPPTASLDVRGLSMRFGGLAAVDSLSFTARGDQITAIIGPNGAGKTTVFNCLTGFYRPTEGEVRVTHADGRAFQLENMAGYDIARSARVLRTFQNIRLFAGMSVLENLMIAQHTELMRASWYSVAGLLGLMPYKKANRAALERAHYWLERVGLTAMADDPAGSLAYGLQRKLEIARAMCANPVFLCLDEPAAGLNPREDHELVELLLELRREQNIAIILIEHDMGVVMNISDHIVVLDHGGCIADGTPAEIRGNLKVVKAYLGEDDGAVSTHA